jgi:hypothetical protein
MYTYNTVITKEELQSAHCKDVTEYLSKTYSDFIIDSVETFGNNIHVEARMPQTSYIPQLGKQLEYKTMDEIRKEIQEQFS